MKKILIFALITISLNSFSQNIFTVTKTTDPDPFEHPYNSDDQLCDPDMYGTLQWAIRKTNDAFGFTTINFNIPDTGTQEIVLNYELPQIQNKQYVTIDGTTQSGYQYKEPTIVINGNQGRYVGLSFYRSRYITIKGLYIKNFLLEGITFLLVDNSTIIENVINQIDNGHLLKEDCYGIKLYGSSNNTITRNLIGTDINDTPLGNMSYGIGLNYFAADRLLKSSSGNKIGSDVVMLGQPDDYFANTIAYNGNVGVWVSGYGIRNLISKNKIFGNPVGISLTGGGNQNKISPIITNYDETTNILSGTSSLNDKIEIFGSTGNENANEYITTVTADGGGNWETFVNISYDYFIATATDGVNNTSALSMEYLAIASTGQSCGTALQINVDSLWNPQNYFVQDSITWIKFVSNYKFINISVFENFTDTNGVLLDTAHNIQHFRLWKGDCNYLSQIKETNNTSMHIDSIETGITYYIEIIRKENIQNEIFVDIRGGLGLPPYCDNTNCNFVVNGDFEDYYTYPSSFPVFNAFYPPSIVNCWELFWGEVDIYRTYPDEWAFMPGIYSNHAASSIGTNVDLISGDKYLLYYEISRNNFDNPDFHVFLANNNGYNSLNPPATTPPIMNPLDWEEIDFRGVLPPSGSPPFNWEKRFICFEATQDWKWLACNVNEGNPPLGGIRLNNVKVIPLEINDITFFPNCVGSVTLGFECDIPDDPSFTYSWSPATYLDDPTSENPIANPPTTTTYTVTISFLDPEDNSIKECSFNQTVFVDPSSAVADAGPDQVICTGEFLNLSTTNCGSGATYEWIPNSSLNNGTIFNPIATPTVTTTYTVSVTIGSCTDTDDIIVTVNPLPIAYAGADMEICSGETITLNATGGDTYLWDNGLGSGQSHTFSPLNTTTYSVTVTLNGCSAVDDVTITVNSNPVVYCNGINVSCFGYSDGIAFVTPLGLGNTYLWDNLQTTSTITNLNAGTYTVTVTNIYNCTNTCNVTINEDPQLTVNIISIDDVICNGQCNGNATALANGGSGTISYQWDNFFSQTTQTANVLCADTYNVTVTDDNGCTATTSVVINEPTLLNANTIADEILCPSNCDGSSNVTVSGGISPYTYLWNNGQTTSNAANLCEGNYSVTITDANLCTTTSSTSVQLAQPSGGTWFNGGLNFTTTNLITTWNQPMFITSTITVAPNTLLNIFNTNIEFSETGEIVVEEGGRLRVNNSTLTNYTTCGEYWPGIDVEGNTNVQDINTQGWCRVQQNSIIENASEAIFADNGAMVYCNDVEFHNNRRDINFSFYPFFDNSSWVRDCHFKIDDYLIGNLIPLDRIRIFRNNFVLNRIRGNTFENTPSSPYAYNQKGTAINASQSTINITECEFINMYKGVYAFSFINNITNLVDNIFINTYKGVFASGTANNVNLQFNDFTTALQQPPGTDIPYGAYLNGTQDYRVWNNDFKEGSVGLYLNNVGSWKNYYVYKNLFQNQITPIDNGSGFIALNENNPFLVCNTFDQNNYDISVLGGRISDVQWDAGNNSDLSAKNRLITHQNGSNCIAGDNAITVQNAGTSFAWWNDLDYRFSLDFDLTDPDNCISAVVTTQASGVPLNYNASEACGNDVPGLNTKSSIYAYEQEIAAAELIVQEKKDSLLILVDNGNTQELLNKVNNMPPNDFFDVVEDLYEAVPYLSDTVLITFMLNQIHRPKQKTDLLVANSPLTKMGKAEIDNTNLPQHFKNILWQYQDGSNAREIREQEIERLESVVDLYENGLIFLATDNDTVPAYRDSLIDYLQNRIDYRAKLRLIPILIDDQDISEAQLQLNELDYMTQNISAKERQYILDFIDLQNIIIALQSLDSLQQDSLILLNVPLLQSIADNELNPYQIDAVLILQQANLDSIQINTPLPDVMANKNLELIIQFSKSEDTDIDLSQLLEIYPNPADNELSVEYVLPDNGDYKLAVFDIKGKLLFSKTMKETSGLFNISTIGLPTANYIISLTNNNKPSKIRKQFSVIH